MAWRTRVSALATALVALGASWHTTDTVRTQGVEPTYTVIDIGTYGGAPITARGASEALWNIVGSTTTSSGVKPFTREWYTGLQLLPTLGGAQGDAYAASGGMTVGRAQLANGRYHAVLWEGTGATDLGTFGGAQSVAYALNGWGTIVGTAETTAANATRAFTYDGLGSRVLTPLAVDLGGSRSIAYDINDAGTIVGTATLAGDAVSHAFLYASGTATDLGSPGGTSVARAVNDLDHAVGYWQSLDGRTTSAFVYRDGSMHTLPSLGGADTRAISINRHDLIVGAADTPGGARHAVLWRDSAIVDLNTLIPRGTGWVLQTAVHVDDAGQIVGYGTRGGQRRSFVLIPPIDLRVRIDSVRDEDTNFWTPVEAGRVITLGFEVFVEEPGGWSTGMVVTSTITGPVEYVSWQTDRAECAQAGQTLTCRALMPIDPGSPGIWALIRARTTGPGTITHTATVTADQSDPDPSDNTATQSNTVISLADLTVATPVVGGDPALSRVTLTAPTGIGGSRVRLSSSNPAVATVPAEFDVLEWANGGLWREFYVTTRPVSAVTDVQISATFGLATLTETLRILPFPPTPWGGTARSVPGQIEAEDYDVGGEGIAYHDTTPGNQGGAYRTDNVDLAVTTDAGGGYNLGYVVAGEWLTYTVEVGSGGDYEVRARVASRGAGGTFHVEAKNGNVSGPIAVPDTGGWQSWRTVTVPLRLASGTQALRVVFDTNGASGAVANLNWFRVVRAGARPTPYSGSPIALPGTVQAEQFDLGGAAVAYHDTTTGNLGGAFRASQVDIQATTDAGGGFHVGWTKAGEWLAYTVSVPAPGSYTLSARVASNGAGGTFHVELGGHDVTGPITVPSTGGWQTFTTISRPVTLTAGTQIMRVVGDVNGTTSGIGNFNYFTIAAAAGDATQTAVATAPDGAPGR
jgi:probable HAF family extracellular repeat protein